MIVQTNFTPTINRSMKEVTVPALETLPTSPSYCRAKVSAQHKQYEDKSALIFHLNKSAGGHKYDIT